MDNEGFGGPKKSVLNWGVCAICPCLGELGLDVDGENEVLFS